ncbi:hypothetical protein HV346_10465 [Enterobacter sp. RHBSTW-00994]|uniref:DUF6694 family lipoprotein n=1 Tax=Enterobacter sp. RHBSTW-00994 TaxID=2742676 RepID=UPI0015EAA827|nr:DUF6694 family lipoprotein [Enterobacter sp. RHBSTW-00994]QLR43072.1 hypothetical protein HV346_10465 [Enterobacter sp. RHBSTW-00994]
MKKMVFACGLVLLLSGCDKPKVDTSTDESMKTSLQKVKESLPEDKRQAFSDAATTIMMSNVDMKAVMAGAFSGNGDAIATAQAEKVKAALNGKTGEEIISEAKAIQAERAKKEQQQALQEIAELQQKKTASQTAKASLRNFVVNKSRFFFEKQEFGGPRPVIELSVENKTTSPVSRAYFKGTIASPGRTIPWLVDTFNYSIPGGLEPGEKANWPLLPNMFSDWGKVQAPEDAVFTVEVVRLDGADGNALFDSGSFSEDDQKRLDMLKSKYTSQ